MKRRIVVAIVVCVVASLPAVYAQKVVVVDGAKVIIDCAGMPAGAVTATPKARATTGTNSTAAGTGLTDIASAASNAQLYRRFEVSKVDNGTGMMWQEAIALCNGLTQDGTGWRLPTQRELILLWILKPALQKTGLTTLNGSYYWSATENMNIISYSIDLDIGSMGNMKTAPYSVRCIREL